MDINRTDKTALEAAAKVLNDHGIDLRLPWEGTLDDREREVFEGFCAAITAYHAALEGRGESEIAEIRGRHIVREHELQAMQTQAFPLLLQTDKAHADRATLLIRIAELERERDGWGISDADKHRASLISAVLSALAYIPTPAQVESDAATGTTADDWRKELRRVVGGTFGSTLPAQEGEN